MISFIDNKKVLVSSGNKAIRGKRKAALITQLTTNDNKFYRTCIDGDRKDKSYEVSMMTHTNSLYKFNTYTKNVRG